MTRQINPEVLALMEKGFKKEYAYKLVRKRLTASTKTMEFDYDAETPKGEWV